MAASLRPVSTCVRCLRANDGRTAFNTSMASIFNTQRMISTSSMHLRRTPSSRAPTNTRSTMLVQRPRIIVRNASTAPQADKSAPEALPDNLLTWDRFFDMRRKRRWLNLGSSIVTAATSVGVLAPVLAAQDIDAWGAQLSGLDPVIVLGISVTAVGAIGWLCGPTFGSAIFSLWAGRRGWNRLIAEKEKSFYARIKRYRADASSSSPQNPPPDYYGEKIGSVKDYRRWLKDQRAFNLKKNKNLF